MSTEFVTPSSPVGLHRVLEPAGQSLPQAAARLDTRAQLWPDEVRIAVETLNLAAALMGTTMAGFVCAAAKKKARALLEQERRVTLTPRDFARVAATLPLPETPITKTFAQIDLAQGMRILH